MIRKLFARIDAEALDVALGRYFWARTCEVEGRRVIAIDGKTIRGARTLQHLAPHLLAALDTSPVLCSGNVLWTPRATKSLPYQSFWPPSTQPIWPVR